MTDFVLICQLFAAFFTIGMFTFGGGYAVMSLIQSEIVISRGWITQATFTDIAAVSQMTPGPIGLNCSTYVGYEVLKNAGASEFMASIGSLTASLAIVLPSFIIMLALVKFYSKFHTNSVFQGVLGGLKPAVAGLIGAAAIGLTFNISATDPVKISILSENFPDWKAWLLFALAFGASFVKKLGPISIIAAGGLLGILIY